MANVIDVAKKAAEAARKIQQSGGVGSGFTGGTTSSTPTSSTSSPDYSLMINQAIKDGASAE